MNDTGKLKLSRAKSPLIGARALAVVVVIIAVQAIAVAQTTDWPWEESLDAVTAAPDSHAIVFENDEVRVVDVQIRPGEREPAHTHRNPSVMITYEPTRIRYFGADGELEFESPEGPRPEDASNPRWMEPEGLHAVENIDSVHYRAWRIELKK